MQAARDRERAATNPSHSAAGRSLMDNLARIEACLCEPVSASYMDGLREAILEIVQEKASS